MNGSIKKGRRYETSALIEGQYEPGSRGRVLRNLIGINKKREMDRVEMREQLRTMDEFERNILRRYTPCRSKDPGDIVHALAVVHTELILIHPFREGNGRAARMLATLMGLQSELPPLDFGTMGGKSRKGYFAAVQAGMGGDYVPMGKIFSAVIRRTLRKRA